MTRPSPLSSHVSASRYKKTNASAFDYDSNAQPLHLNSELYTPHKGPTSGLCNIYTVWGFCTSNGLNGGMSSRGWKLGAKFDTGGVTVRGKIVSLLTMYEIIFLGGVAVWTCSVCRWSAQEKNQSGRRKACKNLQQIPAGQKTQDPIWKIACQKGYQNAMEICTSRPNWSIHNQR